MWEHLYELDITSQVQTSSDFGPPTVFLHLSAEHLSAKLL